MWRTITSFKAALRFHDYKPKPLTWLSASRWIKQFEKEDRKLAKQLDLTGTFCTKWKEREST